MDFHAVKPRQSPTFGSYTSVNLNDFVWKIKIPFLLSLSKLIWFSTLILSFTRKTLVILQLLEE